MTVWSPLLSVSHIVRPIATKTSSHPASFVYVRGRAEDIVGNRRAFVYRDKIRPSWTIPTVAVHYIDWAIAYFENSESVAVFPLRYELQLPIPFSSNLQTIYCLLARLAKLQLSCPYIHPVAAYLFFLICPSLLSFRLIFFLQPVLDGSSHTRCDQSS